MCKKLLKKKRIAKTSFPRRREDVVWYKELLTKNKKALDFLKENVAITKDESFYPVTDTVLYRYTVMDIADLMIRFAEKTMLETNVIKEGDGVYRPMIDNTTTPPRNDAE